MSTKSLFSIGMALAVGMLAVSGFANAQGATPAKTTPTAVKGEFIGKAMCKTEKRDGKDVTSCRLMVAEAKSSDGKMMSDMKSKLLTATGDKAYELQKLDGKEVIVKGTLSADRKSITVESATLRPAPPKPATTAAPAHAK